MELVVALVVATAHLNEKQALFETPCPVD